MAGKSVKTFVIQVRGTDNNTWQGTVDWVEEKKAVAFRSVLELIRLMDSSIGIQGKQNTDGRL